MLLQLSTLQHLPLLSIADFFTKRFGTGGFEGEHLWPSHIGQFLILLSFFGAILSTVSYVFAAFSQEGPEQKAWTAIARISFYIHGAAILSIFATLFYIIFNHQFEYYYAWRHSSTTLPIKYIISCFWEGQEGSFLLWQVWHFVLGMVLIRSAKSWENHTMAFVSFVQVVIGSMLLGIYLFGKKIGVNPFMLLRHEMANAPIFQQPNYLSMIKDGNGLNKLLQNYWMTIHPPVLFLGFASTTIPAAFAVAALVKKDFTGWIAKSLPWTVFSVAALGTGIIMGGAWAYESLSFGGFWAWDPVENASLVPWLVAVAGLHSLIVYRNTKNGLQFSFVFVILAFLFILYSTFLTRSGVLGESSVHSFTDEGLGWQLAAMVLVFLVPSTVLYLVRLVKMPVNKQEENIGSREFWIFIGTMLLLLSSFFIIKTTSLELWNKIFGTKYSQPVDVKFHYNKIQVLFAIIVALLTAFIQYLGYKKSQYKGIQWLWISAGVALIATIISVMVYHFLPDTATKPQLAEWYMSIANITLLFCAYFSLFANLSYLITQVRGKVLMMGGSISHAGFALMLVGIVISQYKQEVISTNIERIDFGKDFDEKAKNDNRLMYAKVPVPMNNYLVTYTGKYTKDEMLFFKVNYHNWKDESKQDFTLEPFMQLDNKSGSQVANPSTRHFWNKDIFTNISSYSTDNGKEGTPVFDTVAVHDTFYAAKTYMVLDSLIANPVSDSFQYADGIFAIGASLTIKDLNQNEYKGMPIYVIDTKAGNEVSSFAYNNPDAGVRVVVVKILPADQKVIFSHVDITKPDDFIIMRAIVFPQINLLWIGAVVMISGALLAMLRRILDNRRMNL